MKNIKTQKITQLILKILLITCVAVAVIFGGVKLITGSSLPNILSALFSKDYKPTVTSDKAIENSGSESDPIISEPVDSSSRLDGTYNFLVCGVNTNCGNQSDVIMIVNYDVKSAKVNIVQIPRDTYINVKGCKFHKINSYYTDRYNSAKNSGKTTKESIDAGMSALEDFIETNININIDYYVYIDVNAFVKVIDSIGGIEVDVPCDMKYNDPGQDLYINLKAGLQTLDGNKAIQFVRFRHGYVDADYSRMNAQKIFMSALMTQIKEKFTISTAATLASSAINYVQTSLSTADFVYFAKKAYSVDLANITMQTMPLSSYYSESKGTWDEVLIRDGVLQVINQYLLIYDKQVTKTVFDSNKYMCNQSDANIMKIYESTYKLDVKTAQDINDNSIKLHTK